MDARLMTHWGAIASDVWASGGYGTPVRSRGVDQTGPTLAPSDRHMSRVVRRAALRDHRDALHLAPSAAGWH